MGGTDAAAPARRRPDGMGAGTVAAMVVIGVVVAVPAGIAWLVIFTRDVGPDLLHKVGRKLRRRWAQ